MAKIKDQTENVKTKYACTIYTMLHILLIDYKIDVDTNKYIWKAVEWFEKVGALLPKGAYFSIIYPAMVKLISLYTGLKFKVKEDNVRNIASSSHTWGIGWKKLSNLSISLSKDDGKLSLEDVELIANNEKGSGHNSAWTQGTIVDSWTAYTYLCSHKTLLYALEKDIIFPTVRTLVPDYNDDKTKSVIARNLKLANKLGKPTPLRQFKSFFKLYKEDIKKT